MTAARVPAVALPWLLMVPCPSQLLQLVKAQHRLRVNRHSEHADSLLAGLLDMNRMHTTSAAYGDATYATSASPVSGFAPGTGGSYDPLAGYAPVRQSGFGIGHDSDASRRYSHS